MDLSPRLAAFLEERRKANEARLDKLRKEVAELTESIRARNEQIQVLTQENADIKKIVRGGP